MRGVLLACAGAWLAACAGARPRGDAIVGQPLDLEVADLAGAPVSLESKRGKMLLLEVWATWCTACPSALASTQRLADAVAARGVEAIGLAVDQDPRRVAPFAQAAGARFPQLWDKGGHNVARALGIERVPTLFVIDRTGVIRGLAQGADEGKRKALAPLIEKLLAEQAPAGS